MAVGIVTPQSQLLMPFASAAEAEQAMDAALLVLEERPELGSMARDLDDRKSSLETESEVDLVSERKETLFPFLDGLLEGVMKTHGMWNDNGTAAKPAACCVTGRGVLPAVCTNSTCCSPFCAWFRSTPTQRCQFCAGPGTPQFLHTQGARGPAPDATDHHNADARRVVIILRSGQSVLLHLSFMYFYF